MPDKLDGKGDHTMGYHVPRLKLSCMMIAIVVLAILFALAAAVWHKVEEGIGC